MKVGLVCPYTWDVPGGVQVHVRDLAENLLRLGHEVSVLAPVDDPDAPGLPAWVVPAGRAVPIPYNGSVARLCFGPLSLARTRRWLRQGRFDVLHLHEPTVPSVSMLAMWTARGALVATFHTSTPRSRALQVFGTVLQPGLEKLTGRIAVSPAARRVIMEHLGGDAVLIPNGVQVSRFAGARRPPERPDRPPESQDRPPESQDRPTVVFLGRVDEPRKGLAVLLEALPELVDRIPDVRVLVAGPGEAEVPAALRGTVELLGQVDDADKADTYARGDVYCAPNTHGESFGIVLLEAMAAGTPVVASDLEAFRRVLGDGRYGVLFPVRDAAALAGALADLLADPVRRRRLADRGRRAVLAYDWPRVADQVVAVYETVVAATPVEVDDPEPADDPVPMDDPAPADDPVPIDDPVPVDDPSALRRLLAQLRGHG